MKRVFLDTNVLLDVVLHRDGFIDGAEIMDLGEADKVEICASYLTYANSAYIFRKYSQDKKYSILSGMTEGITVLPMDGNQLHKAIEHPVVDFEDMLQYQCAKAYGCDYVVTGNKKHWMFSDIPVFTSSEFLEFHRRQRG